MLDRQLAYWNRFGPAKPFSHPIDVARLGSLLAPTSAILDVGCGYGRVLALLHEHGFLRLTGVDPSEAMVAAARARLPANVTVERLADPPHVPCADGAFDAALLVSVLTCVPTDQGQRAIVAEMMRLLQPGGLLWVSDFWLQTDERNRARYEQGVRRHGVYGVFDLPEGVTLRHQTPAWIEHLLERFQPVARDDVDVVTMNGHRARGFQWLGRKPRDGCAAWKKS